MRKQRCQANRRQLLRTELLEPRLMLAIDLPFQNPGQPFDVNRDLRVTALDALLVINALPDSDLNLPTQNQTGSFPDVNGSNNVTHLTHCKLLTISIERFL